MCRIARRTVAVAVFASSRSPTGRAGQHSPDTRSCRLLGRRPCGISGSGGFDGQFVDAGVDHAHPCPQRPATSRTGAFQVRSDLADIAEAGSHEPLADGACGPVDPIARCADRRADGRADRVGRRRSRTRPPPGRRQSPTTLRAPQQPRLRAGTGRAARPDRTPRRRGHAPSSRRSSTRFGQPGIRRRCALQAPMQWRRRPTRRPRRWAMPTPQRSPTTPPRCRRHRSDHPPQADQPGREGRAPPGRALLPPTSTPARWPATRWGRHTPTQAHDRVARSGRPPNGRCSSASQPPSATARHPGRAHRAPPQMRPRAATPAPPGGRHPMSRHAVAQPPRRAPHVSGQHHRRPQHPLEHLNRLDLRAASTVGPSMITSCPGPMHQVRHQRLGGSPLGALLLIATARCTTRPRIAAPHRGRAAVTHDLMEGCARRWSCVTIASNVLTRG